MVGGGSGMGGGVGVGVIEEFADGVPVRAGALAEGVGLHLTEALE